MINSLKIESTLQKQIFCLRNDLMKSAAVRQLLKIANSSFKGRYKFINSLVAVLSPCLLLSYSNGIILDYSTAYFVLV